ncbi:MAG: hypothetical protein JJU02_08225 [Cryomorphaceae bacterium]|nr:hypothetical protein [Cryomorphaceae bacterium]
MRIQKYTDKENFGRKGLFGAESKFDSTHLVLHKLDNPSTFWKIVVHNF